MASIKDRLELLDRIHAYERGLMEAKAHDYSGDVDCNKNIKACEVMGVADAETGLLIRMLDKLQRLISLNKSVAMVKDESKRDTLHDIRNYAAIYIHLMEEEDDRRAKDPGPS